MILRFLSDEHGQDLIEWGLLAAFLSILMIATVQAIAPTIQGWYNTIETDLGP